MCSQKILNGTLVTKSTVMGKVNFLLWVPFLRARVALLFAIAFLRNFFICVLLFDDSKALRGLGIEASSGNKNEGLNIR